MVPVRGKLKQKDGEFRANQGCIHEILSKGKSGGRGTGDLPHNYKDLSLNAQNPQIKLRGTCLYPKYIHHTRSVTHNTHTI